MNKILEQVIRYLSRLLGAQPRLLVKAPIKYINNNNRRNNYGYLGTDERAFAIRSQRNR